jgi:hypothetical protein
MRKTGRLSCGFRSIFLEEPMKFDVDQLVLLGILAASIHWIVARASITKAFWSLNWWTERGWLSVPKSFVADLLACAACSGWWIGLGLGLAGVRPIGSGFLAVMCSGLAGVLVTPVFEGALLWGLEKTRLD